MLMPLDYMDLQGQIQTYDPQLQKHLLRNDDDVEEWINLRKERFRWLTPRATTAGCTPKLKVHC